MTAAMLRHAKAQKFKRTVSQKEEPFRSENLRKFHFLTALVLQTFIMRKFHKMFKCEIKRLKS